MRTHHHRLLRRYRHISPRTLGIGLLVLGLVLVADIVTLRFSTAIEAGLTLPVTHGIPAVRAPAGSLMLAGQSILAQDTFLRANQTLWGVASDGQRWGADAMSSQSFAIVNHTGQVANGNGIYDAVLGPHTANAEVVFTGSMNR